ncbi:amidohydrolase [Naviculisporaceae sp. PSN 640]
MSRIDVHHHFVPEAYAQAFKASAKGDPSGWTLPKWSVESSLELMKAHSTKTAILSITSPGTTVLEGDLSAANVLARDINEAAAAIAKEHPENFGFFATLPPLADNLSAVLEEVSYALDTLGADGVTLFTRYGKHYLGHSSFRPLWDELDKRGAVVFIHPTHSVGADLVSSLLPQPVIDYPHETTRTALDLITSGTFKDHPNVKIILSHAGGTLPYLATRAAHLLSDFGLTSQVSADDFLEQAKSFYFDLALSGNPLTLELLFKFAKPGHVLYGSDFPYAPTKSINTHVEMLNGYVEEKLDKETAYSAERGAALKLFPRFKRQEDKE